ncbi:MAG: histidine phosphatase family protein [Patescibacteria group bacterium]
MKIYLIRHAQEEFLEDDGDGGITHLGRRQSLALANSLKRKGIQVLLTSDLPRAQATAQVLGKVWGLNQETSPTWREIQTPKGAWNEYVAARHPDFSYHPGGGESIEELLRRAKKGWEEIILFSQKRETAVVGHAIFTKALLYNLGFKEYLLRNDPIANTGVTVLEVNGEKARLNKFNSYSHLRWLKLQEILGKVRRLR